MSNDNIAYKLTVPDTMLYHEWIALEANKWLSYAINDLHSFYHGQDTKMKNMLRALGTE